MYQVIVAVSIRHKKVKKTQFLVGCEASSHEAARLLANELAGPNRAEPGPLMELFLRASVNAVIKLTKQKKRDSH